MESGWQRFLNGGAIGAAVSLFEGNVRWHPTTITFVARGFIIGGLANVVLGRLWDTGGRLGAYAGPQLPQIDTAGDPYQQPAAMAGWASEGFY